MSKDGAALRPDRSPSPIPIAVIEEMLPTQSPVSGNPKLRPKSGRKPLQPKNITVNPIDDRVKTKQKPEWIEITLANDSNKENLPIYTTPTSDSNKESSPICTTPAKIGLFDASLAEELSGIRKKLERLKIEKEKTEMMLGERDLVLEMQMQELKTRGEVQRKLEIQVDKLYRLKELELRSSYMRISPIQSLREKEQKRKSEESLSQELKSEGRNRESCDSMDQSILHSSSMEIGMQ